MISGFGHVSGDYETQYRPKSLKIFLEAGPTSGIIGLFGQRPVTPMIHVTHFKLCRRSGFISQVWLVIAIALFSCAASAETYPVSGVWVAQDDRFPGSTAGACWHLKEFGVDAILTQPFPRVMIRFEMRGDFQAARTLRTVQGPTGGGFQITETLGKRRLPYSKRPSLKLKIVDATTIEVTEDDISTRFFKCASNSPSL